MSVCHSAGEPCLCAEWRVHLGADGGGVQGQTPSEDALWPREQAGEGHLRRPARSKQPAQGQDVTPPTPTPPHPLPLWGEDGCVYGRWAEWMFTYTNHVRGVLLIAQTYHEGLRGGANSPHRPLPVFMVCKQETIGAFKSRILNHSFKANK